MAQLVVQIDGQPPVVHELTDGVVTIGRETDNVVVIADSSISRHHAEILAGDGPRVLRDLNSANGTTVNGVPVMEKMLKPGDVIHFGQTPVSFVTKPTVAAKALPAVRANSPLPPPQVRRQDTPPPPAEVKTPASSPAAPKILPAPIKKPVQKEAIAPEKPLAQPAGRTPGPSRIPAEKIPPPASKEPPSPPAPLPPAKSTLPPRPAEKVAPVEKAAPVPAAPAAPVDQVPAVAKAPTASPALPPRIPPPVPQPPASATKPTLPSVPAKTPTPSPVIAPKTNGKAQPAPESRAHPPATPIPPVVTPLKLPLAKVEKAPASAPEVKPGRPALPPVRKQPSPPEKAKEKPPAPTPASELPPVPDDIGRRDFSPALVRQASPAAVASREITSDLDDDMPFLTRRRLVGSGVAALLLLAAGITATIFLRHPSAKLAPAVEPPRVAAQDAKAATTKKFWDQLQEAARTGLQQAQGIPFQQYPVMSNGVYDFQVIDDSSLDALMTSLTTRARALTHVSQELASLDKTGVDTDVVAFSMKVMLHWERAASLDFNAVNLAWAVHERRMRPADAPAPALESADVVAGDNQAPGAVPVSMEKVTKLANAWLAERSEFAEISGKIDAEEKEIYLQLSARYPDQFK